MRARTLGLACAAGLAGGAAAMEPGAHLQQLAPGATTLDSAIVTAPMQLGSGRPVVQVRVNGRGPYDFILDTGAGTTVIDSALAASLGLVAVGQDSIGDPRNPRALAVQWMRADSLQLGGLTVTGLPMANFNIRRLLGSRYGGILGLPTFAAVLVSLDYPRGEVRVTRGELAAADPAVVAYGSADGIVSVPLHIGSTTLAAHLDSGSAGGLMLPRSRSAGFTFKEEPTLAGRAGTVGGTSTVYRARLHGDVKLGPLHYADPEVHLSELLADWANVGFDILRELIVTVDQRHHLVRLERSATGAATLPTRRRIGVMFASQQSPAGGFTLTDGGLPLDQVVPGSLAEKAGLRSGDHLLAVNGRDIATFAPGDLAEVFGGHDSLVLRVRRPEGIVEVRIP